MQNDIHMDYRDFPEPPEPQHHEPSELDIQKARAEKAEAERDELKAEMERAFRSGYRIAQEDGGMSNLDLLFEEWKSQTGVEG